MKIIRIKRKRSKIRLTTIMLLCMLHLATGVYAGAYSEEAADIVEQRVEISLHRVTRFGSVQLFDYLLTKIPKIVSAQQTRILIASDEPDNCRADWAVQLINSDSAEILQEMRGIINDLDPEKQNDILYDAPFIVMREDLELLKKVVPVQSSLGYAAFAVDGMIDGGCMSPLNRQNKNIPWYLAEDAGFE